MAKEVYDKPPIEETTCQFSFAEPLSWEPDTARQLFETVRAYYPAMPVQQQVLQANLISGPSSPTPGLAIAPTERIVFADESGESRLSISAEAVGVHRVRPYLGFKADLLPRIKRDVALLQDQVKASRFKSISIRYVNKIEIPSSSVDLSEYFNHWGAQGTLPVGFDGTITGFFYRTAAQDQSQPLTLLLNFGSVAAEKDMSAFVLDIDLTYTFPEPVTSESAIAQMIETRKVENAVFESLITERTRELFR